MPDPTPDPLSAVLADYCGHIAAMKDAPLFRAILARHGLAVVPVERIIVAHVDTTQGPPAIHITTATKDAW
jgi:hypothetical protein